MAFDSTRLARARLAELSRQADRVSVLVLRNHYPPIDVLLAVESLRREAVETYPGCDSLFEMVYVSRFRRLWQQFRECGDAPF